MALDMLPTPQEMVAYLDRFVLGQARAKYDVAVAVYNHYLSQAHRDRFGTDLGRHHILLIGPTGVGKTYMVKLLAEYLGVPFGFASAAGLVEAGYVGNQVETIITNLLARTNGDAKLAERGFVFIDEIDKIRRARVERDVSGEGVQNALLTLLDGRIMRGSHNQPHDPVDTSRLLFVCAGAFVDLKDIILRRIQGRSPGIGFSPRSTQGVERAGNRETYEILCQVQPVDLEEFGFIPEFIGRFACISVLHELGKEDLRQVLTDVGRSPLALQQRLARIHGIDLEITDDALDAIAEEAAALGTGVRGLHRLIGRAVDSVDYRWPELADEGVKKVVIDLPCARGHGAPRLIKDSVDGASLNRIDRELRKLAFRKSAIPADSEFGSAPSTDADGGSSAEHEHTWAQIYRLKEGAGWANASPTVRNWWERFEKDYAGRPGVVLQLLRELQKRNATISDLFNAYIRSATDNIQAVLYYLDYMRAKEAAQAQDQHGDG